MLAWQDHPQTGYAPHFMYGLRTVHEVQILFQVSFSILFSGKDLAQVEVAGPVYRHMVMHHSLSCLWMDGSSDFMARGAASHRLDRY